jgi:hypothetical protein
MKNSDKLEQLQKQIDELRLLMLEIKNMLSMCPPAQPPFVYPYPYTPPTPWWQNPPIVTCETTQRPLGDA